MKTVNDLQLIKKYYGENMMHLCRTLFPTLLEKPGLLFSCLSKAFAYSKFLYDDIVKYSKQRDFVDYIYSYVEDDETRVKSDKTPQELLASVGYDLYECHTEEDIQSFKKYYARGEDLCTFDGGRLYSCYVFFAVKKNVDDIIRENFKNPQREDEYGTSVMSIQFDKGRTSRLSIKNRYNHTVLNPDATYSNNLDNIVPGLTNAFLSQYPELQYNARRTKLSNKFKGYVKANDGKLYKYYYNCFKTYYCTDNVIIDNGEVKYFDKNKYLLFDQYILDIDNKCITKYIFGSDSFTKSIGDIDKLLIRTTKNGNKIIIINYNTMIILNSYNQMIEYHNNIVDSIGNYFLEDNNTLRIVSLPNVDYIGSCFLARNTVLEEIYLPNVEEIREYFLAENLGLKSISLPNVLRVSYFFLHSNRILDSLYMPEIRNIGSGSLYENRGLRTLSLPNIRFIEHDFMPCNNVLQSISLDDVRDIGDDFLRYNNSLEYVNLPNVENIGNYFMERNTVMKRIGLVNTKSIGNYFLGYNESLEQVDAPLVERIGSNFLSINNTILRLDFPKLISVKENFMIRNKSVQLFNAPSLEQVDFGYFDRNENIDKSNVVSIDSHIDFPRPQGMVLMGHYHNTEEFHRRRRTLFDLWEPLSFDGQTETTENTFDEEEPVVLKKVA
ncbi:MAG: hypothetical protein IKP07_02430 [Bacilli bacterium]|nr:hypothetical protein [Bacilli bacterium]